MSRRALRLALAAVSLTMLAGAADPERVATERELRTAEQALGEAEAKQRQSREGLTALQGELLTLSTAMQGAVADLRQHERTIAAIGDSLHELEAQRNERQAELESRREQAGSVLSALVRLTALPPEAALVGPGGSDARLRTAADVLKGHYHEFIYAVARIKGGWEHLRDCSSELREYDFEPSHEMKD